MRTGQLRRPYRQRITAYCAREGIVVPPGFDRSKGSDRLVLIDMTSEPPTLVSRSTYLESSVIAFLDRAENAHRRFRILDFKRGCELQRSEGKRLKRGAAFDVKADGELSSLVIQ